MKKILVSLLFFSFCIFAEDSYLEINGVTSKASSANSLAAKQTVFSNALSRAFGRMLSTYFPKVRSFEGEFQEKNIQDCLYDYSVDQEKFSGKTYIARFSFRFSKKAVQKLLRKHNLLDREAKISESETVAIYTQDYLKGYDQLKEYKVVIFSPKRIVLEIPETDLKDFLNSKITFAKINAKIPS